MLGLPENRVRVYDVREAVRLLADDDSVLELRSGFGRSVLTALVRVEGRPLGLVANENLQLNGTRWDARYVPAFIRRFPFLTAGVQGSAAPGVFVDAAWKGFSDTEGEALFDADGKPTEVLANAVQFLQRFDEEQQRTRLFCSRILELDLLKEMQAELERVKRE